MKKVVRLTESQLIKFIKNVIQEQNAPAQQTNNQQMQQTNNASAIFNALKKAISGMGTDEEGVEKAVNMISSQSTYNGVLQLVRRENPKFTTIMKYILTDFQIPAIDKPAYTERSVISTYGYNNKAWDKEGWSKGKDTQLLLRCAKKLQAFNKNEMSDLVSGSSVDRSV